ncbi:MAG: alginate O-acetyltransferase AlgX-related protein [Verrucomicrobiota bacterium]
MNTSPHRSNSVGSGRRPGFISKLILLGATTLLACVAAEAALQLRSRFSKFVFRAHAEYLYTFRPGKSYQRSMAAEDGGSSFPVVINSEGRRGALLDPNRPKIVVYGDSSVAGEYCPVEKTFAARLENRLGENGWSYQVVNCGVTGFGPDQQLLRMQAESAELSPRLIVVVFTEWNDLGDLMRNGLFALDATNGLARRHPIFSPQLKVLFDSNDPRGSSLLLHYLGRVMARFGSGGRSEPETKAPSPSIVGREMFEYWLPFRQEEFHRFRMPGELVVDNLFVDTLDADVILDPESESSRYKIHLLEAVVRGMMEHARSVGVPILFVTIPSAADVYKTIDAADVRKRHPGYRDASISAAFARVFERLGAMTVRLDTLFASHPADTVYLPKDGHWSPEGQRLAAEAVGRWVEAKSLVPKSEPKKSVSR